MAIVRRTVTEVKARPRNESSLCTHKHTHIFSSENLVILVAENFHFSSDELACIHCNKTVRGVEGRRRRRGGGNRFGSKRVLSNFWRARKPSNRLE